jgi:hypothetical protein
VASCFFLWQAERTGLIYSQHMYIIIFTFQVRTSAYLSNAVLDKRRVWSHWLSGNQSQKHEHPCMLGLRVTPIPDPPLNRKIWHGKHREFLTQHIIMFYLRMEMTQCKNLLISLVIKLPSTSLASPLVKLEVSLLFTHLNIFCIQWRKDVMLSWHSSSQFRHV